MKTRIPSPEKGSGGPEAGSHQTVRSAIPSGIAPIYAWYRGIVLGCEGRYEEAIELIRNFIDHHPRYGSARVTLALDHPAIGRMDQAREMIDRAHREDPGIFVDGMALMVGAHPDPGLGLQRAATLRSLWPQD